MPARVIRSEINSSRSLSRVSMQADLLFRALICVVDDYGRGDARPALVRALCFPMRPEVTDDQVGAWLRELAGEGCVQLYEDSGGEYLWLTGWERHRGQGRRGSASKYPEPLAPRKSRESADRHADPSEKREARDEKRGTRSERDSEASPRGASRGKAPPDWAFEVLDLFLRERESALPGSRTFKARATGARVFERMQAEDGLSREQIETAIRYAFGANQQAEYPIRVLTPAELRAKLDALRDQQQRKTKHGRPGRNASGAPRDSLAIGREIAERMGLES